MAQTVRFDHQSNGEDFAFTMTGTDEDTDALIDFTGMVIACAISDNDGVVVQVRSDDGSDAIVIDGTTLEFMFAQTLVSEFSGTYRIGCVYLDGTSTTQLFIGTVAFYDGVAIV